MGTGKASTHCASGRHKTPNTRHQIHSHDGAVDDVDDDDEDDDSCVMSDAATPLLRRNQQAHKIDSLRRAAHKLRAYRVYRQPSLRCMFVAMRIIAGRMQDGDTDTTIWVH
jgi:hypothetical protein